VRVLTDFVGEASRFSMGDASAHDYFRPQHDVRVGGAGVDALMTDSPSTCTRPAASLGA
jgi:hypothetical protein